MTPALPSLPPTPWRPLAPEAAFAAADLVAVVSHELRTPLTSIRGALQLAIQDLAGADRRLLGVALKNCDRMVGLVNDLLDLSRIESGHFTLTVRPVSVGDVVHAAIESIAPLARAAAVSIESDITPEAPAVSIDPDRMTQVLVNLLSNAIKVAPADTIITVRAAVASRDFVEVSVTDRGPGIPAEQLSRLFRKFEQLNGSATGTGLGLAISKAIVEQHGGRIAAASVVGVGTTLTVAMPAVRQLTAGDRQLTIAPSTRVA